ncbi:MAG: hypothetical protein LBQ23_03585 [Puniceicoccales bacterium]|jgi:uncharacterized membrane protein YphA (DoxX/SURF4 family)|nr:hypothetical protein [Puniceicoccales bacterium]
MSGSLLDKENFGKLFIRLVLGIILAAKGITFFIHGQPALTLLGKILSVVGITFWTLHLGWAIAICYIVCGITMALGAFFKTSTFLLGTFSLLEAAFKYYTGGDPVSEVAHMVMLSATMYGFVFIGSGSYSVQK